MVRVHMVHVKEKHFHAVLSLDWIMVTAITDLSFDYCTPSIFQIPCLPTHLSHLWSLIVLRQEFSANRSKINDIRFHQAHLAVELAFKGFEINTFTGASGSFIHEAKEQYLSMAVNGRFARLILMRMNRNLLFEELLYQTSREDCLSLGASLCCSLCCLWISELSG